PKSNGQFLGEIFRVLKKGDPPAMAVLVREKREQKEFKTIRKLGTGAFSAVSTKEGFLGPFERGAFSGIKTWSVVDRPCELCTESNFARSRSRRSRGNRVRALSAIRP